jgi:hypothetical protein
VIADEPGKCSGIMLHHVLGVVSLEVTITRCVKEHDDSHHFRQAEARGAVAPTLARREQALLPAWFKEQAEIVDVTENG